MNTKDYYEKVHALLDEEDSYSVLKKDPTKATERKLLSILEDLHKEKKISDVFYDRTRPSEGSDRPARFYGRVKLHKENAQLGPVVTTCGTSTYNPAQR